MVQSTHTSPDTQRFISAIESSVNRGEARAICDGVKAALEDLASRGIADLPESHLMMSDTGYARHLLHQGPDKTYSILVMVWGPGQGTAIHDHAGKWCVECVVDGEVEVVAYDPVGDPTAETCGFRETERMTAHVGDVGVLVPPQEYHHIANVGAERAITVHVYEGEMLWCHTFHPMDGTDLYRRERLSLEYD